MKLSIILLVIGCLQVHAGGYAQKLSLTLKDASLTDAFRIIKKQTGYTFLYNDRTLDGARKVTLDIRDGTLEEALNACFKDQPFSYSIVGRTIVVKERGAMEEPADAGPLAEPPPVVIRGKVVDENNKPIPAATITVKGGRNHAVSDDNGEFTITVSDQNAVLLITSVGYQTFEIRAGGRAFITARLTHSETAINEVVVTALGIKKERRAVGYAVSTISGDELLKAGATMNPFLALYGKASGVGVNTGAAGPMGGLKINIRGAFSLNPNQNVRPLFVVDGVIISDRSTEMGGSVGEGYDYGANINDLNSEDIESIDILKGAKATVLYGTDAANGVVLITTKSGKNAKGFGMTGSLQYTIEHPKSYLDEQKQYGLGESIYDTATAVLNGQTVRAISNDRFSFGPKFDGTQAMFYDSSMVRYSPQDGYKSLFSNGHSYNANVAIQGSSEKGSLRASYTNYKYVDIMSPNSTQQRNTFSFNGNIKASNLASFELVTNVYNIVSYNRREENAGSIAWGFPEDYSYQRLYNNLFKDATGYQRDLSLYGVPTAVPDIGGFMWDLDKNSIKDDKFHIINSAKATVNFTKHLSLMGQFGLDYDNTNYTSDVSVTRILPTVANGAFDVSTENNTVQTYQGLLNYDNTFHSDFHLNAFGGFVYRLRTSTTMGENTIGGLNFPGWYSLNNQAGIPSPDDLSQLRNYSRGSDVLYSGLGSATISYKSELYLEFQAREDWNSTLPPQNNKYFYPGTSITWNYTDRFHIKGVNNGQVRLAWANVGNGTTRYFANNQYNLSYISGTGAQAVSVGPPSNLLPGALSPERDREVELGINNSFFKGNRLTLDMDVYANNRYNQIISLPVSNASSSSGLLINVGNVRDRGFEFSVTGTPVMTRNIRWDITVNGSRMGSRVMKLYGDLTTYVRNGLINGNGASVNADLGKPAGEIMNEDYNRDPDGNKVVGSGGIYTLNSASAIPVGNVMPKLYGGVLSDFHYKNLSFRIGLDYKYGGTLFSYTNMRMEGLGELASTLQYRDAAHGGQTYYLNGSSQIVPLPNGGTAPSNSLDGHTYHDGVVLPGMMLDATGKYVKNTTMTNATNYYEGSYTNDLATAFPPDRFFKNDYIKVREVALSYSFSRQFAQKLHFQSLSATVAGRNLFYLYKSIPNIDVESATGADDYVENTIYPGQQTFSLGINVGF